MLQFKGAVTPYLPATRDFTSPEPFSTYEILCQEQPSLLGKFFSASKFGSATMLPFLIGNQFETTASGNEIFAEECEVLSKERFDYPGLVVRDGNDFTLDTSVFSELNLDDLIGCSVDPANIIFSLSEKTEIIVRDDAGIARHGLVESISDNKKTITVLSKHEGGWGDLKTTDLSIEVLATDNNKSDCGSCFAIKNSSRYVKNGFRQSSSCYEYNQFDWTDNARFVETVGTNGKYHHDRQLDNKLATLFYDIDKTLLWGKSTDPSSDAANAGIGSNFKGMMEQLIGENYSALLMNGFIDNREQLYELSDELDKVGAPNEYVILANREQYRKLQNMVIADMDLQYNPFCCDADALKWLSFKSIEVNGRVFHFKKWDTLSQGIGDSPMGRASNPNFIMMPMGQQEVITHNGMTSDIPYISVVWNGNETNNWKLVRKTNMGSTACPVEKLSWFSRYSLMVVGREHFVVGMPAEYDNYGLSTPHSWA